VTTLDPVARRLEIATRAAEAYRANPHVASVLVAGSVGRGLADEFSDIELDVYWSQAPTDEERIAAVEGAGWARVYDVVDENEWADGYSIDGVKVDTSGFLTSTIDRYLDAALDHGDPEPELQVRITALHGHPLYGQPIIDEWRSRCRDYPRALALAMSASVDDLRPRERLEMLAARDDVLLLHRDLVDNVHALLDALFGLNQTYVPHPFHKWLTWECTLLATAPADLADRIRHLLVAAPHEAVDQVCALTVETFAILEQGLPDASPAEARAAFEFRRVG
jgi:hypothetical protein